jgi:hypothetical protein
MARRRRGGSHQRFKAARRRRPVRKMGETTLVVMHDEEDLRDALHQENQGGTSPAGGSPREALRWCRCGGAPVKGMGV